MIHLRLYGLYCAWFFVALTSAVRAPAAPLTAADYLINVWSSENGLPQNSVNCLAQTPDGYLWVGTRSGGLARFDGDRFVTFNPQTTLELKCMQEHPSVICAAWQHRTPMDSRQAHIRNTHPNTPYHSMGIVS